MVLIDSRRRTGAPSQPAKKTLNSCQTQRKRETNNVVNCNEPNGALSI